MSLVLMSMLQRQDDDVLCCAAVSFIRATRVI